MDITDHRELSHPLSVLRTAAPSYPETPRHENFVRQCNEEVTETAIRESVEWLSSYHTRHHNTEDGERAVQDLASKYKTAAGSRLGQDVTVKLVPHTWRQPSLVVTVSGTGKHQDIVILGS